MSSIFFQLSNWYDYLIMVGLTIYFVQIIVTGALIGFWGMAELSLAMYKRLHRRYRDIVVLGL